MKQMEQKKPIKTLNYNCEKCNFRTANKKDYNRHILTSKHQNETNETKIETKTPQKTHQHNCEKCSENFNSRTSLWRHKQKCTGEIIEKVEQNDFNKEKDLISFIIQQFVQLQKQTQDNIFNGNNNTINSHNKAFNLQFFLNETCKNAMNIKDFADSVELELSDLENVGKNGYIQGISNIIIKNLNALEVEKRPIHCTDNKREIIYIKDEDKWEKEEENKPKLRKLIREISHKNICMFKKYREKYPDCDNYDSKKNDAFNKIVYESMGGKGDDETVKEKKIINNISKQIIIEKS